MSRIATIAHLSDFHFVENIRQDKQSFGPTRLFTAPPHSFSKIEALSIALRTINQNDQEKTDLTVITGDITTDGRKKSFRTALKYFYSDTIDDEQFARFITLGLKLHPNNCLLVPGNHDRYKRRVVGWQSETTRYEEAFGLGTLKHSYPKVVGYRPNGKPSDKSKPTIIFFMYDTTHPKYKEIRFIDKFARGYLSLKECNFFAETKRDIELGKTIKSIDGSDMAVDYNKSIKIAVLHHDPFEASMKLGLENHENFRDQCAAAKIDVVMYGHTHRSDIKFMPPQLLRTEENGAHRVHYIRAPSASEIKSYSGFYIYDVNISGMEVTEYEFDAGRRQFIIKGRRNDIVFYR